MDGITGGRTYATWPTLEAAAAQRHRSTRTIERQIREGAIRAKLWRPDPGSPFRVVCHPADVAKGAPPYAARDAAPAGVPATIDVGAGAPADPGPDAAEGLQTRPEGSPGVGLALVRELIALVATVRDAAPPAPAEPLPRTVDVEGAAALLNWTPRDVRAAVRAGTLPASFSDRRTWRRWRIWREDLERLRPDAGPVRITFPRREGTG